MCLLRQVYKHNAPYPILIFVASPLSLIFYVAHFVDVRMPIPFVVGQYIVKQKASAFSPKNWTF